MNKIVIVGNGKIDKELGAQIDAHDIVVRFNGYKTKGYEKIVGHKTDIWVSCGDHFDVDTLEYKEVWVPFAHRLHGIKFYEDIIRNFGLNSFDNLKFIPEHFCEEVSKKVGYKNRWASSGILAIEWALKQYGNVSVAGFSFYEENVKEGIDGTEHYFGNDNGFVYWAHSPKLEYKYGQDLRKDDRVKFL